MRERQNQIRRDSERKENAGEQLRKPRKRKWRGFELSDDLPSASSGVWVVSPSRIRRSSQWHAGSG